MWIRRLAVEHWRGLSYVLEGLEPGLNLIAGANESGKSRLVEALRFALFESSSGQAAHKRELETWGVAPEQPRVAVDFELGGIEWQLEKVFLGKGCNTRLRGDDNEHTGEAAEAKLAELLGVAASGGRTEVKPEDRGIWSLLWVEQGTSREQPAHSTVSQSRILNQLSETIGEVAAGEFGIEVLNRAEEYRNRYYTPKSSAEKSTLAEPRRRLRELEERLDRATARRAELAAAADALARTREEIRDLEERHSVAEESLRAATDRQAKAQELRHALDLAEERVTAAQHVCDDVRNRLQATAESVRERHTLEARIEEARGRLRHDDALRTTLERAVDAASADLARVEDRLEAAETTTRALRRRKETNARRAELERLQHRHAAARQLVQRQAEIQAELATLPRIGPKHVAELRNAVAARASARARLDGASVSLSLTAHRDVLVDGIQLPAGTSTHLLANDDRRIDVSDLLTIDVRPGAGELVALRDALRDAERTTTHLLAELMVPDVEHAAQVSDRRERLEEERERLAVAVKERVPEGVSMLERRVEDLEASLGAAGEGADANAPFDPAELDAAEADVNALDAARAEARARRDTAREQLSEAREQGAALRSGLESLENQLGTLVQRLAALPADTALQAALEHSERTFGERVAARDALRHHFESTGGERLGEDVDRAAKAETQLRRKLQDAREGRIRLETTLSSAGEDGRHEQVQELEAEREQARSVLDRVLREATAARRLFEVLEHEYQSARERLTRPVIARIRPYLEEVFPGCEAWLDEALELKGLRSSVANERFEALSGGAREQLSLLVRIGLAEVVGSEESWPLVLDDVLVNTDAARIQRVQRALYHAGRKMQILLFTCHGALFDTLGPDAYIELPAPPPRAAPTVRIEVTRRS